LCQRELLTPEKLQKHLTSSELHRKNLEAWRAQRRAAATRTEVEETEEEQQGGRGSSGDTTSSTLTPSPSPSVYRDRAAERRQRDGIPEPDPNAFTRPRRSHKRRSTHDSENTIAPSKVPRTESSLVSTASIPRLLLRLSFAFIRSHLFSLAHAINL
jgi:hypothetical protein